MTNPYTLKKIKRMQEDRLSELISVAGNASHLARMLNKPNSTIQGWVLRGRVSKLGAKEIEAHPAFSEKFNMKYLRPDINE